MSTDLPNSDGAELGASSASHSAPSLGSRAVRAAAPPALLLLGAAIAGAGLTASEPGQIGGLGLVEALHPAYYAGFALVVASFLTVWRRTQPGLWATLTLAGSVAAVIVLLHGAPWIIEEAPRFPTAYVHAGFSNHIAETGQTLPDVDARFSWPGFFAFSALLQRAAGDVPATLFLEWWPVLLNALFTLPVFALARRISGRSDVAWLAVLVLPVINWIGQDYYSPQSVALLMYLSMAVLAIGHFGDMRPRTAWLLRRDPSDVGPDAAGDTRVADAVGLAAVATLALGLAMGHQLTPVAAVAVGTLLVVLRVTQLWSLPLLLGLVMAGWISYGASAFWVGHLDVIFGGVGAVESNVGSNVAERLVGSEAHLVVLRVRVFLAALVWALSALALLALRGWHRRAAATLLFAPFLIMIAQSYGGEALLRVYLFTTPASAILIAVLLASMGTVWRRLSVITLLLVLLVGQFLVARWGNESFEMTRSGELAAVEHVYDVVPDGAIVAAIAPQLPWRAERITELRHEWVGVEESPRVTFQVIRDTVSGRPEGGYALLTTSQLRYAEEVQGHSPAWGVQLLGLLDRSPDFRLVYENADARLYRYEKENSAPVPQP